MSDDMHTLSEDERAELERLRQEKKLREAQVQAAAERAELERLRAEEAEHIAEVRARGAKLMQPDEDDLRMPIGQKIVIISVVLLAILFFIATFVVH